MYFSQFTSQMQKQPKILIAPSAYKGSLTPSQVGNAVASGLQEIIPAAQIKLMPLADGGDGTIESIHTCLGGEIKQAQVFGPLGEPETANWLILKDWTVIELAKCCGLAMIADKPLQPLAAHTYGLGEVILRNLDDPCSKIIIGVGGSASTDGGTGALRALGIKFLDQDGKSLPLGGGALNKLASIDVSQLDKRIGQKQIEILTDVSSPLTGPKGAAHIFAPQKGADEEQVKYLDASLSRLADVIKDLQERICETIQVVAPPAVPPSDWFLCSRQVSHLVLRELPSLLVLRNTLKNQI